MSQFTRIVPTRYCPTSLACSPETSFVVSVKSSGWVVQPPLPTPCSGLFNSSLRQGSSSVNIPYLPGNQKPSNQTQQLPLSWTNDSPPTQTVLILATSSSFFSCSILLHRVWSTILAERSSGQKKNKLAGGTFRPGQRELLESFMSVTTRSHPQPWQPLKLDCLL